MLPFRSVHFRAHASPHLPPVSFRVWRNVAALFLKPARAVTYYSLLEPDPSVREQIRGLLSRIQSPFINTYERLPDGTEIWGSEVAPMGTKLEVTSEKLAESVGQPWRLIEETAYAVGKELGLRIRRGAGGETYFSKEPL